MCLINLSIYILLSNMITNMLSKKLQQALICDTDIVLQEEKRDEKWSKNLIAREE